MVFIIMQGEKGEIMKNYFNSTRNKTLHTSVKDAILQGLAPDGGLYVTDTLGHTVLNLNDLLPMTYEEMAPIILSALLPGFTTNELETAVFHAYHNSFSSKEVTPVVSIDEDKNFLLELFHGPTSAFKDVALQMLPQLMSLALKEQGEKKVMILAATSGDTGKAALCGFQDVPRTGILVFYPKDGTSAIQRLQMETQEGSNTSVCALIGNFDDAQSKVKELFHSPSLQALCDEKNILFSSANSINIGRLAPQAVYYFYSYFQLVKRGKIALGDEIDFCVPTGNFGDILAGYYAKLLGLPVHKLIVASNANNVLTDFFTTGTYDRRRPFHKTLSPSMDILISSNLERLLYYMSGNDDVYTKELMDSLQENGHYTIKPSLLAKLKETFYAGYCTDEQCKQEIHTVYEEQNYVLDPHTAVGYHVMKQYQQEAKEQRPCILLSTASPYKFCGQVYEAITGTLPEADEFALMELLSEKTNTEIPKNLSELKEKSILHNTVISKEDMDSYVLEKTKELFMKR